MAELILQIKTAIFINNTYAIYCVDISHIYQWNYFIDRMKELSWKSVRRNQIILPWHFVYFNLF